MLSEENQYRLLKALGDNPQLSQRELSRHLGMSLGKVNYCLKALVHNGLIKVENFHNSSNKSAYLYVLTAQGLKSKTDVTLAFLRRKQHEYDRLQEEIEVLREEVLSQREGAD